MCQIRSRITHLSRVRCYRFPIFMLFLSVTPPSYAQSSSMSHSDPIAPVILGVTGILFFAVLGRFAARKVGQPSVLGELLMGVLLGNLGYYFGSDLITILRQGPEVFDVMQMTLAGKTLEEATHACVGADAVPSVFAALSGAGAAELMGVAHTVDILSRYGVIFLMFMVGLDTDIKAMRKVGAGATRVAIAGVIIPVSLGFAVISLLAPNLSFHSDLFIAATLGATSVGITARVLADIKQEQSRESHMIIGAAIIDDILGLLILTIVSGIIVSGVVEFSAIVKTVVLASAFLLGAMLLGPHILRFIVAQLCRLDIIEAKMFTSILFVMVLAWIANLVGLATIVGAFTAGLILHEAYFINCRSEPGKVYTIKDLIMPLEVFLVPIFFVLMGMQVKLETFLDQQVILIATGLIVAAIIGKIAAGFFAGKKVNKLAIGFGMMPRGEVGLIFAAIGKTLGVIDDMLFSSIVLMVITTTLIAPPLLKLTMQTRTQ